MIIRRHKKRNIRIGDEIPVCNTHEFGVEYDDTNKELLVAYISPDGEMHALRFSEEMSFEMYDVMRNINNG